MSDFTTPKRSSAIGMLAGAALTLLLTFPLAGAAAASTSNNLSATAQVAVVGASISRQAANAAGRLDKAGHFTRDYPAALDGGTVNKWADPADPRWVSLDDWLVVHPDAGVFWFQIGFHQGTFVQLGEAQLYADAEATYQNLKSRLAGRAVYVSPMFHYLPGSNCKISDEAVDAAESIVTDLLAAHPALVAGPVFEAVPPEQVDPTGCHTNAIGDDLQGAVLNAYFDAALG